MSTITETEPERLVLFQPRSTSSLVVNLSAAETYRASKFEPDSVFYVDAAQADGLAAALQEERISQAVLSFGSYVGVWHATEGDIKETPLTPMSFRKAPLPPQVRCVASGSLLVSVGSTDSMSLLHYKFRAPQFRLQSGGAACAPAVLLANALNCERVDEKLLLQLSRENAMPVNTRSRAYSAYDRLETATLLAARHAGVAPEQPSSADLVRLVCRGLDIFSERLNTAHSDVD